MPEATPVAVAAFLRGNPGWLAAQDALYSLMDPPCRVHGEQLADHMAALLAAARTRADHLAREAAAGAADRRAAEGFGARVQDAVLMLMRAPDPAWCLQHDLPALLRLDGARLCVEGLRPGMAAVPMGTVTAALGQRQALVRGSVALPHLHGEAAGGMGGAGAGANACAVGWQPGAAGTGLPGRARPGGRHDDRTGLLGWGCGCGAGPGRRPCRRLILSCLTPRPRHPIPRRMRRCCSWIGCCGSARPRR